MGPFSVDRHADIQASLNAMQIQSQPMRERPQAVSLQKKVTLQKRLEPINISSVGSPQNLAELDKRIISPSYMPKSTTAGKAPI